MINWPDLTDEQWLQRLSRFHNAEMQHLEVLDAYYEGDQPLSYMHPELLRRLDNRVRQVVINWPELVVDSLDERLDVTGFRLGGQDERDEELWRIWQANRMDLHSQQAHVDALVMGRAFAIVGADEDDPGTPLVTVESPLDVYAELDPRTHRVRAALKRWRDDDTSGLAPTHATLYLPDRTVYYGTDSPGGTWREIRRDDHKLGTALCVPIVNRPRTRRRATTVLRMGRSELSSVIPLSDAANKVATDMMISAEYHAMPRRYALGFDKEDFVDAQGNPLTPWEAVAGVLWASPKSPKDDGVAVGQFPEASLGNFHDTLNALARLVASLSGLPPHFLGYATENPASADGIRSSESRHIKRAERKQLSFGDAWEEVNRLVFLVRDGRIPRAAQRMETMWVDAATPTFAAQADAITKLHSADRLLPRRAARRALGFTPGQILDMEAEDREAYSRVVGGDQAAEFGPKPEPPGVDAPEDETADMPGADQQPAPQTGRRARATR